MNTLSIITIISLLFSIFLVINLWKESNKKLGFIILLTEVNLKRDKKSGKLIEIPLREILGGFSSLDEVKNFVLTEYLSPYMNINILPDFNIGHLLNYEDELVLIDSFEDGRLDSKDKTGYKSLVLQLIKVDNFNPFEDATDQDFWILG